MEYNLLSAISDVDIDNDGIWILSDAWNVLFKYVYSREELELVAIFPEEIKSDEFPFFKLTRMGNEIYFTPQLAKNIFYYSLLDKQFHRISVACDEFQATKNMGIVKQGKYIYCINRFPDKVIKIDSETKEVNMFSVDNKAYINEKAESCIYRLYRNPCIYKNKIVFSNYGGVLVFFDLESEQFTIELFKMPDQTILERTRRIYEDGLNDWIVDVCNFEDELWLVSFNGKIYRYYDGKSELQDKSYAGLIHYQDTDDIVIPFFGQAICMGKKLLLIPQYKNKCVYYNFETNKFEIIFKDYLENWKGYKREYTVLRALNSSEILAYSYHEKCFYILDIKTESVEKKILKIPYLKFANTDWRFLNLLRKNDVIYEFDELPLICKDICTRKEEVEKTKVRADKGKEIYEIIKEI